MIWVKGTGRAYILYIYAHGREEQAPQPSCGEQDGRGGTGQGGREGGDGRETEPRSKTAGHSGYNGRGTGDRQAPQPSCGEQDGRGRDGTGSENGERDVRRRRMGE